MCCPSPSSMDAYVLPVQITSSFITVIGILTHSLVIYLTLKKRQSDSEAYGLFMRIYSTISIVRFITGWMLINRLVGLVDQGFAIVYYGVGSLLGPRFCNILDAINSPLGNVVYNLVPTGMAFRTLIAFDKKLTSKHVAIVVTLVCLSEVPTGLIMVHSYSTISNYFYELTIEDQDQVRKHSAYAIVPPFQWEIWYTLYIAPNHTYVCVPLTFLLGLITWMRLNSFRQQMSERTARIHRAFVLLLFLEAISLCLGLFVDGLRDLVIEFQILPDSNLPLATSFYAGCLLALIPTVQGLAMLTLIPYFRSEVRKVLGGRSSSEVAAIATSNHSTAPH